MTSIVHTKIVAGVKAIVATALMAGEQAKDANFIRVEWTATTATITTHVNGRDVAWIEMDGPQIEELIRQLRMAHSDLTGTNI